MEMKITQDGLNNLMIPGNPFEDFENCLEYVINNFFCKTDIITIVYKDPKYLHVPTSIHLQVFVINLEHNGFKLEASSNIIIFKQNDLRIKGDLDRFWNPTHSPRANYLVVTFNHENVSEIFNEF